MSSMKSIQNHNSTVLQNLEPGDTVEFKRGVYSHWAVYVGDSRVVHMAGADNDGINANVNSGSVFTICGKRFKKAMVKIDDFWDVACDSKAYKNNSKDKKFRPCDVDEILHRALSMLGEVGYNVLWQNCEHFASFCRYGISKSDQAEKVVTWSLIGAFAAAVLAIAFGGSRRSESRRDTE